MTKSIIMEATAMDGDQKREVQPAATAPMTIGGNRNTMNKPVDANGNREWSHDFYACCYDVRTYSLSLFGPVV
jgi:hypothetical protein